MIVDRYFSVMVNCKDRLFFYFRESADYLCFFRYFRMKENLLRELPSVDDVLRDDDVEGLISLYSRPLVTWAAREALSALRESIISGHIDRIDSDKIQGLIREKIEAARSQGLKRMVNASGTVIHTNIGRSVLSDEAVEAVVASAGCCNLEFDLGEGARGERDALVEGLLTRLTGAEAACVVNNNAAAVLITLNTLAEGKEVVISRGELIEIGGSFRLPEIINKSGCILKEVGTTNRTHPLDYISAINPQTGVIFKAHTSNYRVIGFTAEVDFSDLVKIGRDHGCPVVEDLGSGSIVDLTGWGLPHEPVVSEVISAGADVVTFSGDKLLGGPQAGLIVGRKEIVGRIRKNPLKRALRAGKLTLAALEATLRLYLNLDKLSSSLPIMRFLTRPLEDIENAARTAAGLLVEALGEDFAVEVMEGESVVGGGTLPGVTLPTRVVSVINPVLGPDEISKKFLSGNPPILGRIKNKRFLLDMRCIEDPSDVVPVK